MSEQKDKPKGTLLVSEDDPLTLQIINKMLQETGYQTHSALDGKQCLEMAHQLYPDLILMDIIMPRIDGIEACRRLKADPVTNIIPVIFITAHTDDQTLQEAYDVGGCDFIRKPISHIELLARVETALSQRSANKKLAEDEKLKGVLETAGAVCHELNQPLQYVLGAVQLLMMDVPEEDAIYQSLDGIRGRVEQMGEITRKLMDITRYRTRKYAGGHEIIDIDQSTDNHDG